MKFKKEILIVGGTGFIGYHLAKRCLKDGFKVTSISASKPKKIRYLKRVKYLICDISKRNNLNIFSKKKFLYVVNLGGYVDHSDKKKTYNSHYLGCKNLTNFFIKKKIQSFVQIGSSSEYGNLPSPQRENFTCKPKSIYGKAKLLATNHTISLNKKNEFPSTVLRLYQAYGPRQDLNRFIPIIISGCLKNKKFPCSEGKQFRDFVYVDDVVEAILKCFKNKKVFGEIINIGSGKTKKIKKIIEYVKDITKKGTPLYGRIKLRKDETLKIYPDISKAKKKLKWKSKITFEAGLAKTINFYEKAQ